jgi:hypothetical protein
VVLLTSLRERRMSKSAQIGVLRKAYNYPVIDHSSTGGGLR